jgi:hypothetical protein
MKLNILNEGAYAQLVRTYIQRGHKHGRHKNKEWRESFILKQMYFSVNNDNATAWKYIELKSSAVQWFQNWTIAWKWPSKAETCSNSCDFNLILN